MFAAMAKKGRSEVLKKYKLTNVLIAKYFNYSTDKSFANSSSCEDVKKGIERVIEHVEQRIKDRLSV